jgi:hypothetical protein
MLYSPALTHPFDGHNAAADVKESACLSGVNPALTELKSQEGLPSVSSASLVYAGYPYDPCA